MGNVMAYGQMQRDDEKKFTTDVHEQFSRESGGAMSRWTYLGEGGVHWTNFVKSGKYYQPQEDSGLILKAIPQLKAKFQDVSTIVEFGPGDERGVDKTLPLIRALPNVQSYVLIDLASELLTRAEAHARANLPPHIDVVPINGDFFRNFNIRTNGEMQLPPNGDMLGVFWGSTISNVNLMEPPYEHRANQLGNNVVNNLKRMGSLLKKGQPDHKKHSLAMSWDSNSDLDAAVQSYDDDNWKQMILGYLHYIDDVLKPVAMGRNGSKGFHPDRWHYEASIDSHNFTVQHIAVADRAQEFRIDNQFYSIPKGARFVVVNNAKMPTHYMRQRIMEAGFKPHQYEDGRHYIPSDEGRMVMMTCDI